MKRNGVCYDTGRVMMGTNWRPSFDVKTVSRELEIIKADLHCNAVRLCGQDTNRLAVAAEIALKLGLEVWLSPELWDQSPEATLDYLAKAAATAEALHQRWPDQVIFSVGSELTLFMQGIVPGSTFFERLNGPAFWETVKTGAHNKTLNAFLAKANAAVRQVFHGKVVYMSVPLETVDWSLFDFVGVDLYRDKRVRDSYGSFIERYLVHNKPVVIGEFGCCTYQGADDAGGMGWAIIDMSTGQQLDGEYVRDEALQAREIASMLAILESVGANGGFVFTFVTPTFPHIDTPRYDLDMASYGLVKSFVDKCGTTYPEMPWEPKESFNAVAEYYANH